MIVTSKGHVNKNVLGVSLTYLICEEPQSVYVQISRQTAGKKQVTNKKLMEVGEVLPSYEHGCT